MDTTGGQATDLVETEAERAIEGPGKTAEGVGGKGFEVAYRFLNRRERTVAEVRARLERAEISGSEVDLVLAELIELGYLDDARYARVFTEDKRNLEAWGSERIARVLRERGVDRDLIEGALAGSGADPAGVGFGDPDGDGVGNGDGLGNGDEHGFGDELGRALSLLVQRFPAGPGEARDRQRAFGVLARKGYESETAADAVREWARRTAEQPIH